MRVPRREKKRPQHLDDYVNDFDLRSVEIYKKTTSISFKFKNEDSSDFHDWWGWVLLNIRSKMDHTVSKNFSLTIGIVNPRYISRLFDQFEDRKIIRNLRIRLNAKRYLAETYSWRFIDINSIIPHDGDKKIYQNYAKEFINSVKLDKV